MKENTNREWDLIVIGGGVTGAGILREAVRMGFETLLLERMDFAWGTSSRSSKLVHGGLRYLKQGDILTTLHSVRERERLLREAPGLVEPLGFLFPVFEKNGPGRLMLEAGLTIYSFLSLKRGHKYHNREEFARMVPDIRKEGLKGGFHFLDAQVDDAGLVLRLIDEAVENGGHAENYTAAARILRDHSGDVAGVEARDTLTGEETTHFTKAVINATGAWAEQLHPSPHKGLHLRPLRGSHLIFPRDLLPVDEAVTFIHPEDKRPLFVLPWEGAVLFGTTDMDHSPGLATEPFITRQEADYLMDGLAYVFPDKKISLSDCLATTAGLRPVLSRGTKDPSAESREHVVWTNKGLVTITGGKLTTFRKLAVDTLRAAKPYLPQGKGEVKDEPVFAAVPLDPAKDSGLDAGTRRRLFGRYGTAAEEMIRKAGPSLLEIIPGTRTIWAELPFTAERERVRTLGDLLLRRVRIGILCPRGGMDHIPRIRELCSPFLPWDDERWEKEIRDYAAYWEKYHGTPL